MRNRTAKRVGTVYLIRAEPTSGVRRVTSRKPELYQCPALDVLKTKVMWLAIVHEWNVNGRVGVIIINYLLTIKIVTLT